MHRSGHTTPYSRIGKVRQRYVDGGELCSMAPKDGTTTCHRYCTAYVVYPFEVELLLADSGFYNERLIRHTRDVAGTVVNVPKKPSV